MSRYKPYTLTGAPDATTIEQIDQMLDELYQDLLSDQHALLSGKHSDTVAATAVRGDVITAQSVPGFGIFWERLAIGGAGKHLRSDGTDVAWSFVVLTSDVTGILGVTNGGTGLAAIAQGDLLYGSALNTLSALAKSTSATRYLANTGASNNPAWAQVDLTTGVTGRLPFANLTQLAGLSVLGVAGNVTADAAAITAASDNQVLRRSGTSIAWGSIDLAQPNTVGTSRLLYANLTAPTTTSLLLGRNSSTTGNWQEITLARGLSISAAAVLSYDHTEGYWAPLTDGDHTTPTLINNGLGDIIMVWVAT